MAGLCLAAGLLSAVLVPLLFEQDRHAFSLSERYFQYPVSLHSFIAHVRRDSYGKGQFGASRNGGRKHEGVDLLSAVHMPVYAAKSGRVARAEFDRGYGKYIELAHADGLRTRYAHLSEFCVQPGDWVGVGQVIGTTGKTGNAAHRRIQPHLHFEIRQRQTALNPSDNLMNPKIQMR